MIPSDAYSIFEKLNELQLKPEKEKQDGQKTIGMRNAIVHDYLNLGEKVIRTIIEKEMYIAWQQFILNISERLNSDKA